MKLIIDIDENVRIAISRIGLLSIPDEMQKKVDKAIQHGKPLDKIREEIKGLLIGNPWYTNALFDVLDIIDKYREG